MGVWLVANCGCKWWNRMDTGGCIREYEWLVVGTGGCGSKRWIQVVAYGE